MNLSIVYALAAAALFGASTPLAKSLGLGLLAGLLYLGSGLGLAVLRLIRDRGWKPSGLTSSEWPWLLGAIGLVAGLVNCSLALYLVLLTVFPITCRYRNMKSSGN